MSNPSPLQNLAALLKQARELDALPLAQRTSEKLLIFSKYHAACQDVLDWLAGFESVHRELISKVQKLLEATSAPYQNGSLPDWHSEIQHGKAPAVRKARDDLIKFLKTGTNP